MPTSGTFQNPTTYKRSAEQVKLLRMLEEEADSDEFNIDRLVKMYKERHPGEAVWCLSQDINRQAIIWFNVLETLKRGDSKQRAGLKNEYENVLQLLPEGSLSNPNWPFDVDRAFEKLKNYSKGLLKLARSYALELLAEINVQPDITATVQIQLGLPPSLTIGLERNFSVGAPVGRQ